MLSFLANFIDEVGTISLDIIPIFLGALFIAAILEEFLSTEVVERWMQSSNPLTATVSSISGALIPICTCGMIPLSVTLRKRQAGWVPVLAFLTAGVATSIPALLVTLILGWHLTVLRFLAAIVFGIMVAYAVVILRGRHLEEVGIVRHKEEDELCECAKCEDIRRQGSGSFLAAERWKNVLRDYWDELGDFAGWIVISILIAGLVEVLMPQGVIEDLVGKGHWYSTFVSASVGLPFYFCAGSDVPLIQALLAKGMSTGSAVSIMTAVPVINLPAIGIIGKWLGRREMIYYMVVCWFAAAWIGLAVNLTGWT